MPVFCEPRRQHDAQEFFNFLCTLTPPLSALLHHRTAFIRQVNDTCSMCERHSHGSAEEATGVFPLPPPGPQARSVRDLLRRLIHTPEPITKLCNDCQRNTAHARTTSLPTASEILALHIPCFRTETRDSRVVSTKLQSSLIVPPRLQVDVAETPVEYQLFASVLHLGPSVDHGHYIAVVERGAAWYKCDDDDVQRLTLAQLARPNFGCAPFLSVALTYCT